MVRFSGHFSVGLLYIVNYNVNIGLYIARRDYLPEI